MHQSNKRTRKTVSIEESKGEDESFCLEIRKPKKEQSLSTNLTWTKLESTVTDNPLVSSTLNAPNTLKKTVEFEKVFIIEKGCSSKRRKHMLKYSQISMLENYFHKDPQWTPSTIGEAAKVLNLNVKKVYKWGYDRKLVSRNLNQVKPDTKPTKINYNKVVDDILGLKTKEVNLRKRKYERKSAGSQGLVVDDDEEAHSSVSVNEDDSRYNSNKASIKTRQFDLESQSQH